MKPPPTFIRITSNEIIQASSMHVHDAHHSSVSSSVTRSLTELAAAQTALSFQRIALFSPKRVSCTSPCQLVCPYSPSCAQIPVTITTYTSPNCAVLVTFCARSRIPSLLAMYSSHRQYGFPHGNGLVGRRLQVHTLLQWHLHSHLNFCSH